MRVLASLFVQHGNRILVQRHTSRRPVLGPVEPDGSAIQVRPGEMVAANKTASAIVVVAFPTLLLSGCFVNIVIVLNGPVALQYLHLIGRESGIVVGVGLADEVGLVRCCLIRYRPECWDTCRPFVYASR